MENRLRKLLGNDIEVLRVSDSVHLAVVSRSQDGVTVYMLVKLCSFEKPNYNEEGFIPTEKQLKKFYPIIVKYALDMQYIVNLFEVMTLSDTLIAADKQL